MKNAQKDSEAIRAVGVRLQTELAELDRLGQNVAGNALNQVIELLNDGRGRLERLSAAHTK